MGGASGRVDAMIAAVEARKAEGVLHAHGSYYFQTAGQLNTLLELSEILQAGMLSSEAMKNTLAILVALCIQMYNDFTKSKRPSKRIGLHMPMTCL